jgi:hypothetical protein
VTQLTAGYFASTYFPSGYWQSTYFPFYGMGLLGRILAQMEKANVGDSYWDRGLWEDGMWEHDTPMINTRKQMEKM